MDKAKALESLRRRMEKDTNLPLRKGAKKLVFGEGNPQAFIYFLGEAPGRFEDELGRPFVGRAGKLLDDLLKNIGIKRGDVYISNIVHLRPPNNRQPTDSEIEAFSSYVDGQIEIIEPKLVVTLGRFSLHKFLPLAKISQVHGKLQTIKWHKKIIRILPIYHPAAGLRNINIRKKLEEDFGKIAKVLPDALRADV